MSADFSLAAVYCFGDWLSLCAAPPCVLPERSSQGGNYYRPSTCRYPRIHHPAGVTPPAACSHHGQKEEIHRQGTEVPCKALAAAGNRVGSLLVPLGCAVVSSGWLLLGAAKLQNYSYNISSPSRSFVAVHSFTSDGHIPAFLIVFCSHWTCKIHTALGENVWEGTLIDFQGQHHPQSFHHFQFLDCFR